jgi:hypothetical protein
MIPACGPARDSKGGSSARLRRPSGLSAPASILSGGGRDGPSSTGGDGGAFSVRSQSAIDVTREAAPAPPSLPSTLIGHVITDLSADRVVSGNAIVSADSCERRKFRDALHHGERRRLWSSRRAPEQRAPGILLERDGHLIVSGSVRTSGGESPSGTAGWS